MNKNSKQIAVKSVGVVFILTAITSVVSFFCEMLYANYFGVSIETDAFTIAYQIPTILFSVVSASVSTTIVPIYSQSLAETEKETPNKFISKFFTLVLVLSIVFVVFGELLADLIVKIFAMGVDSETHNLAVKFVRYIFPIVIVTTLISVISGALQVHKKFGRSTFLILFRQCLYALLLFFLNKTLGIYAAVFGTVLASLIEFILSIYYVKSIAKIKLDFKFKDEKIIKAAKMSLPIFLGIGATELNQIIDKLIASFLDSGNISMLSYASRLSGSLSALLIGVISTVMFPYFAEFAAKKEKTKLSNIFFLTQKAYLFLTIPIIAGGIVLRNNIVEIVFLRGAFTQENADVVAGLFAGFIITLVFSAIRQTGAKLFYAEGNTKTPMINMMIGICINIVLNIVLGYYFEALGLVYATVISTAAMAILMLFSARKYINNKLWKGLIFTLVKTLTAAFAMSLVLILIMPLLQNMPKLFRIIVMICIGAIVYGILLFALDKKEIKEILLNVRRK